MPEIVKDKTDQATQNTDRVKEITDKLEQGIQNLFEGERFKEYLDVMSKFHNYSYKNTMLIAMQKPDASRVAGFNSWKNKFGRTVTKGEKGIQILAPAPFKVEKEQEKLDEDTGLPMRDAAGNPIIETVEVTIPYFKVVNVFDVSQTYGKELPTLGAEELNGGVKDFEKFFEALKTVSPAPIEFEKIEDGGKGYYHHENKKIAINEDMSEVQTAKTAIHEIAHAKLHDRDLVKADLAEPRDRRTMEVEAEAIAYTVCQHYGIDTSDYSFAYIAEWGSGKEMNELKSSLETIRTTANELITKIDENILAKSKEQVQEQVSEKGDKSTPEKQSNIIGNTKYADIEDKNYFKLETAVALAIAAELQKQGVPFSGRTGKANTTLTIGGADVEKYKAIEQAVKPPAIEKPKAEIFGNTPYKDIPDKQYFNVENNSVDKVKAALEVMGVSFSGKANDNSMTTFTVSAADADKFREAEKLANNHKTPPVQNKEPLEIIGTVKFTDIADKTYSKLDNALAIKVAEELEAQGFKFSGRVNGDKTTITLDKADLAKYKAVVAAVKSAEAELKVADKFPDKIENPEKPDIQYTYEIYQLADTPENRNYRFTPMAELNSAGLDVSNAVFNKVYAGIVEADGRIKEQIVEDINTRFNVASPEDFKGHSLSVGDVIALDDGDNKSFHFCDRVGFVEIPEIKQSFPPVYLETLRHAVDVDGDKALFHNSHKLNCACAEAIDKAISTHNTPAGHPGGAYYDFDVVLKEVAAEYGTERVNAVVAHTVNKHDWDGRLSDKNKEWAKTVDVPQVDYIPLNTHLAVFDGFVNHVREADCATREQSEQIAETPTVPTVSDLKEAVDKGESISITELAKAVKAEKPAEKVHKVKKSIKARIEADKAEKRAAAENPAPTAERKSKGEAEL